MSIWRIPTGTGALDIVLGDTGERVLPGVIQGSLTVICGPAEQGRTTLALQVAYDLATAYQDPCKTLFVSASQRAAELDAIHRRIADDHLVVPIETLTKLAAPSMHVALRYAVGLKPDLLVVDDIHLMEDFDDREFTLELIELMADFDTTIFLTCSSAAVPTRSLAHVVSTIGLLDSPAPNTPARRLRAIKNDHAPLAEAPLLMTDEGLISLYVPARRPDFSDLPTSETEDDANERKLHNRASTVHAEPVSPSAPRQDRLVTQSTSMITRQ